MNSNVCSCFSLENERILVRFMEASLHYLLPNCGLLVCFDMDNVNVDGGAAHWLDKVEGRF